VPAQGRADEQQVDVAANRLDGQPCRLRIAKRVRQPRDRFGLTAVAARQPDTDRDVDLELLEPGGASELMQACRRCFASLFTTRAISYRIDNGFDHFKVALSVAVMKMVRSDLAASGVIFTLDTESGFRDVVFVTGAYGLGENIVQGAVDPDEFYVHKPTFDGGFRAVLSRRLGGKEKRMVYARGHVTTRNVRTSQPDRKKFCIDDKDVLELAQCAIVVENHYSRKAGTPTPMDIEWAKDGTDGTLYIIQARPETVASRRNPSRPAASAKASGEGNMCGRSVE